MKKFLTTFLGVLLLSAAGTVFTFYRYCTTPTESFTAEAIITIPRGSSSGNIADLLEARGVISSSLQFQLLAKLKNAERTLKPGEFRITPPMSPLDVLEKLSRGDVITYPLTVPEGSTLLDIAAAIQNAGLCRAGEVLSQANNATFIASLKIDGDSLEGFLFPDTYRFSKGISAGLILAKMVRQFELVFTEELRQAPAQERLSKREIVILASLLEKETASQEEKPLIAGVLLNRLRKGMRLECDPSVAYGVRLNDPSFQGRLRKKHLRAHSPYNTYQIYGLPPGPICSPGRDSLHAALNPARVDYLYFVSKNDGTHKFSKTLREHRQAVDRYQRRR